MKKIIIAFLTLCLAMPGLIKADGFIVPPNNYVMWETAQTGVIFYESDTETETLAISMAFEGNAADFGWIIPTPNKPEVAQGSQALFTALEELTGVNEPALVYEAGLSQDVTEDDKQVTVVEQKTIDYYEVSVLSATDSNALSNWLSDNGYNYPEEYTYLFNEYINNNWYFTAAKIIPETVNNSDINSALNTGTATPLQLTFSTENIVYPMKISQAVTDFDSVSNVATTPEAIFNYSDVYKAPENVAVNLYIIADKKQDLQGFTTKYADKIKTSDIEDLAIDTNGDPWVSPQDNKYFLTKLYKYHAVTAMNADLFPQDAEDNEPLTSLYQWDDANTTDLILFSFLFIALGFLVILISPLFFFFLIFSFVFYLVKNKKVKVSMAVLQILDTIGNLFLVGGGIVAVVLSIIDIQKKLEYSSFLNDEIIALSVSIAVAFDLLILMIAKIIALIIQKKKYGRAQKSA